MSAGHLSLELLLQDWLGEADAATREAVDEHLMACDACGTLFDEFFALGQGVRDAVHAGRVPTMASQGLIDRLAARGLRVREYRVPAGGSVNCTLGPSDDVLVGRLQVPLAGVQRLDLIEEVSFAPGELRRLEDIPFDAASGELLYVAPTARVRPLPAHVLVLTLVGTDAAGTRELGRYEFRHSPWAG